MYLHDYGDELASFTKEDIQQGYVPSSIHSIIHLSYRIVWGFICRFAPERIVGGPALSWNTPVDKGEAQTTLLSYQDKLSV